jgi:lysophospholipase L1-like esterase
MLLAFMRHYNEAEKVRMSKKPIVATIGDSLTQGNPPPNFKHPGTYQHWMKKALKADGINVNVVNWGIGGQIAHEIATRVPQTLPCDILVMMGGTNDIWRYSSWDDELSSEMCDDVLEQLAWGAERAKVREDGGAKHLIICSVPPFAIVKTMPRDALKNIAQVNAGIEEMCARLGYHFCNVHDAMALPDGSGDPAILQPDGVHFKEAGNHACGEAVARCVAAILNGE